MEKIFHPPFSQREQLAANAALAALANQHRMPSSSPPTLVLPTVQGKRRSMIEINHLLFSIDDPDVNVVDMDDGIEREENHSHRQSTMNETSSSTADQR